MRKTSFGVQAATLTYRAQHTASVQNKLAAVGHKETEARSEFLILVVATRIYTHTHTHKESPEDSAQGPGKQSAHQELHLCRFPVLRGMW